MTKQITYIIIEIVDICNTYMNYPKSFVLCLALDNLTNLQLINFKVYYLRLKFKTDLFLVQFFHRLSHKF